MDTLLLEYYIRQILMKTYNATAETAQHHWYIVDAADKTLGRISTVIAAYLRGKINQNSRQMWILVITSL